MIGFRADIVKRTDFLFFILFISLLITNLVLVSLPLTKYFSYEYSVVNGFIISLFSVFVTIRFLKKINGEQKCRKFARSLSLKFVLFFILPFSIAFLNSFKVGYCPFSDGIPFYLIIVLPSFFVAMGIAGLAVLLNEKYAYLIAIAVIIIILLIPVLELSFNPQVYFYNPIVSYFPGNIYDEGIAVDTKLSFYRILNIFFFGSIFVISVLFRREFIKINKKFIIPIILFTALIFIYFSSFIGLSTTNSSLRKVLSKSIETKNFKIFYSGDKPVDYLKYLAGLHEYYYEELTVFFDSKPKEKIVSYIFNDRFQKQNLFGAGNADVAKPWLNQIYISEESIGSTLKHELAHLFTADFGKYLFKVADKFNPALIEGVASAADNIYDEYDIHYLAAIAHQNDYQYSMQQLFDGFNFFSRSSGLSYIYAGSFTSFLIDRYGIQKLKELYRNLDFNKIYNKTISELDYEYRIFLKGIKTEGKTAQSNYYFGRKSLFQKACPRFLANETAKLYHAIEEKDYLKALELTNKLEALGSNYPVVFAKAISLEKLDLLDESISFLKTQVEVFSKTAYEYNLSIKLADNLILFDKPDSARVIYIRIVNENPSHRLLNIALIRLELMNIESQLKHYISGDEKEKYEILAGLNDTTVFYPSIPLLISLHKDLNLSYHEFLPFITDIINVDNDYGFYAALKISEYSLNNLDFENALKFIKIAKKSDNEFAYKLLVESHEKKIKWFIQNINVINLKGLSG